MPDDTNGMGDVFVEDLTKGVVTRVSVDASGAQSNDENEGFVGPVFSPDGRKVAFVSR